MTIGNKLPNNGGAVEMNKWYIGLDIVTCPQETFGLFKPRIHIYFIKAINRDHENYCVQYKGFWKTYTSPLSVSVEVVWKNKVIFRTR